jgi:transmembrane sensor
MSDEILQKIAQAGRRMDPGLSDRDVDRLVAGAAKRRRIRRAHRQMVAGGSALVLIAVLFAYSRGLVLSPTAGPGVQPAPSQTNLRVLRLADGSTATAIDSGTELVIVEDANEHAVVSLARGRGRFNVMPRPQRVFLVHAGNVTVTVLGTLFTVERVADRVGITVETGTVRVEWTGGAALLQEGGTGWYPPLPSGDPAERTATPRRNAGPSAVKPAAQVSARAGQATPLPPETAPETTGDLLAAADNARLSGRPAEGAELLRKLLRNHRSDPRAPLAAFTLGRMLLIELHKPLEAAAVFADARRLSPSGPLAEDSLAREIEALHTASEVSLAKIRAQEYLRLYPEGRRAPALRMLLGTK